MEFTTKSLFAAVLAALIPSLGTVLAEGVDRVAQESGEWDMIKWAPDGNPEAGDVVYIEGGFTVNYTTESSPNLSRLYIGDEAGKFSTSEGTLEISGGMISINANAAGACLVGRADQSTGTLNITGGTLRGLGNSSGAGMQVAFGAKSTGTVTISAGELVLGNGVVVGYGDSSTGHFRVSGGIVTAATNAEAGPFNVGARQPGGGTSTATFQQTGGSVTIASNYFGVGYAGSPSQIMEASAEITGGTFTGNVRVGRQHNIKSGGGDGGTLTIAAAAKISGRDEAWEVSGNGKIIFVLGTDVSFNAVDLTSTSADQALVFSQDRAEIVVDGAQLPYSKDFGPITLISFPADKGPSDLSKQNLVFDFTGFDSHYRPDLVWTETSLQLILNR